jgi:hypothetical protein
MQGIALILTVLQIVRLPNIKVCCCFQTNHKDFDDPGLFHGPTFCYLHDTVYNVDYPLYAQVSTVLLSCAFLYDVFWVFISPKFFHESVMIVVRSLIFPL